MRLLGDLLILMIIVCCIFWVIRFRFVWFIFDLMLILMMKILLFINLVMVIFSVFLLFIDVLFMIIIRKCFVFGWIFCRLYICLVFFRFLIRFGDLLFLGRKLIWWIRLFWLGGVFEKLKNVVVIELKKIML